MTGKQSVNGETHIMGGGGEGEVAGEEESLTEGRKVKEGGFGRVTAPLARHFSVTVSVTMLE